MAQKAKRNVDTEFQAWGSLRKIMNLLKHRSMWALPAVVTLSLAFHVAHAQDQGKTSYMKVDITEPFASILARMQAAKPDIERRHSDLLNERYDLSDRPARGVMMERNKPLQEGVASSCLRG